MSTAIAIGAGVLLFVVTLLVAQSREVRVREIPSYWPWWLKRNGK